MIQSVRELVRATKELRRRSAHLCLKAEALRWDSMAIIEKARRAIRRHQRRSSRD